MSYIPYCTSIYSLYGDELNLSKPCDKEMTIVFVRDYAFQLTSNLMKPYPQIGLTEEQLIFNYRLNRAQTIVENAFVIGISFSI